MPVSEPSTKSLLPSDLYEATAADKAREAEERSLGIVKPSDPGLLKVAKAVSPGQIQSVRTRQTIARLYEVAQGQRKNSRRSSGPKRRTLVGLAAPQIQKSVRIILVDTSIGPERKRPGKLECFINPEIVWRSRETEEGREGCFSTGSVWGLVRRPVAVKIRALNTEGKEIERILEGFTARIALHEIDHLDGIRFPERIKDDQKRHWVHAEELELYPKLIHTWPRLCTNERWERLKRV